MKPRKKIHKFNSKIIDIKQLTHNVKHFTLSVPEDFDFYPGQFVSFILEINGREVRRPYSIASNPRKLSLDIVIKILEKGLATPLIDKLKQGDEIKLLGPMGAFTINDPEKNIVFISTGTGIGPFRSMIQELSKKIHENKITLLTGYRKKEDILYEKEFKDLEKKDKNFSYHNIFSQDKNEAGEQGYVQKLVEENIDKENHYYICGLKDMINSVKNLLLEKGIPAENIFFEKYD